MTRKRKKKKRRRYQRGMQTSEVKDPLANRNSA
jgi:hypothetical protein